MKPRRPSIHVPKIKFPSSFNESPIRSRSDSQGKSSLLNDNGGSTGDIRKQLELSSGESSPTISKISGRKSPQSSPSLYGSLSSLETSSGSESSRSKKLGSPKQSTITIASDIPTIIKQYSVETSKPAINHQYLLSISTEKLKLYCKQTREAYISANGWTDGTFYKQIDIDNQSPKNSQNENTKPILSPEILLFKKGDSVEYYLLDKNLVLGGEENRMLCIGYPIPDMTKIKEKRCHDYMIDHKVAVKIFRNNPDDLNALITGLKINDQYIKHFSSDTSSIKAAVLMKYIEGQNLFDMIYEHDSNEEIRDEIEYIIGRRYLKPEIIFHSVIDIIKAIMPFILNDTMHTDIKAENFMINGVTSTLIDADGVISTNTLLTATTGSAGHIPWEITPSGKYRMRYTQKSDLCALFMTIAEIITLGCPEKEIRVLQPGKECKLDFTYEEVTNMMPDVFKGKRLIVPDSWEKLPIDELYDLLADSLVSFLPEDIKLLKDSPADIINHFVFREKFFPKFLNIIFRMTQENAVLRPSVQALPEILNQFEKLQQSYLELSMYYQNISNSYQSVRQIEVSNLIDPFLTCDEKFKFETQDEGKKIHASFRSSY